MNGVPEGGNALKALESLHVLVQCSLTGLKGSGGKQGVAEGLEYLSGRLRKVRTLAKEKREIRIGVFGPPKRGKSTLLNVFLGGDVLPSGKTPMTHCAVELYNIAGTGERSRMMAHNVDGSIDAEYDLDFSAMRDELERRFLRSAETRKIQLYGDFSAGIVLENSVLLDTPGAEAAFEEDAREDAMGSRGAQLRTDTERALEMLSEVDVPLFCMRADNLGSEGEANFYERYMRRIRPINVVNFKDEREDVPERDLLREAVNSYGVIGRDTVFVSAKEGLKAIRSAGGYCAVQGDAWRSSGIERLVGAIKDRLKAMQPAEALRRVASEYFVLLVEHAPSSPALLPPRVHWERLRANLAGFAEAEEVAGMLIRHGFIYAL